MAGSLTGCNGAVTVGDGPTINITEWESDIQRQIFADDHFEESADNAEGNAKKKVGGMAKMIGRCTGFARVGTTPGIGTFATEHDVTGGTFNLVSQINSSATDTGYTFTGLMSNMTVDVIKTGLVTVSFDFESQGAVTKIS